MDVINGTRRQHFYVNSFLCNNKWQINVLLAINMECSQHKCVEVCTNIHYLRRSVVLGMQFIRSLDPGYIYLDCWVCSRHRQILLLFWSCQCRKWHNDNKFGKPDTIIAIYSFVGVCLVLSFYWKLFPDFEWNDGCFSFSQICFIMNEDSTWNEMWWQTKYVEILSYSISKNLLLGTRYLNFMINSYWIFCLQKNINNPFRCHFLPPLSL